MAVCGAITWSQGAAIPTARAEPPSPSAAPETANDCVTFTSVAEERGIQFEITNSCHRSLQCKLSWAVVCGEDQTLRTFHGQSTPRVARSKAALVSASATGCGAESWEIKDVEWSCA